MLNINPKLYGSVFAVPAAIIDKYIKLASPIALKALLYVLRNQSGNTETETIAKKIGYSVADTEDAILFWINENVLIKAGDEVKAFTEHSQTPVLLNNDIQPKPVEDKKEPLPEIKIAKPTLEQITKRMDESREVSLLMTEAQQILGRTFGFDVQSTLLMLYDTYGLKLEVIFTLLEFCVQQSRASTAYIAKLGKIWAEKEINTLDGANEYIEKNTEAEKIFSELRELTGISTPRPTPKQSEYLSDWLQLGYGADMISRAYEETSERTGKISFNYMNKILLNWHEQGYKTPADVEAGIKAFREKKSAVKKSSDTSFDINEAINEAMYGTVKYKKKERREN